MDLSKLRSTTPRRAAANTAAPRGPVPVTTPAAAARTSIAPVATPAQAKAVERAFKAEDKAMGAPLLATPARAPLPAATVPAPVPLPTNAEPMTLLDALITRAIGDAFSDRLPDDPTGINRSLEVRRRAYVQAAALAFVNHNPKWKDDGDGAITAMIRVRFHLAERQTQLDARVRKLNGLAPASAPHAAPVTPRPPILGAVEKAHLKLLRVDRMWQEADLTREPRLRDAAIIWLDRYQPSNTSSYTRRDGFLLSVRSKLDVRPQFRAGSATPKQVLAVLNTWKDVYKEGLPADALGV